MHCGFRQDELECEEAVTHLTDCCPGFNPTKINCTHEAACDLQNVTALPVLESQCILRESCETIVKTKVCDRLTSELADTTIQTSGVIGETRQAEDVCP